MHSPCAITTTNDVIVHASPPPELVYSKARSAESSTHVLDRVATLPKSRDENDSESCAAPAQLHPSTRPFVSPYSPCSNESSPKTSDEECLDTIPSTSTDRQNSMGCLPASTGGDHATANNSKLVQCRKDVGSMPEVEAQHASVYGNKANRTDTNYRTMRQVSNARRERL